MFTDFYVDTMKPWKATIYCHLGESRGPEQFEMTVHIGFRFSPEWRLVEFRQKIKVSLPWSYGSLPPNNRIYRDSHQICFHPYRSNVVISKMMALKKFMYWCLMISSSRYPVNFPSIETPLPHRAIISFTYRDFIPQVNSLRLSW